MKIRLISGALYLSILLISLFVGRDTFAILILLAAVLALKELIDIKEKQKRLPLIIKIISFICLVFFIFKNYNFQVINHNINISMLLISILLLLIPLIFYPKEKYNIIDAFYLISTTIFIALSFNYLIIIKNSSLLAVLYVLLISMTTDTFAYIGGKLVGKTNFSDISPNKTVEGSLIGTFFATIIATFFYIVTIGDIDISIITFITIILSILAQVGDLVFSDIKRYFEVKDYSTLIKGHGGILDRFDSVIFVTIGYILLFSLI